jgi:hypothetical protein
MPPTPSRPARLLGWALLAALAAALVALAGAVLAAGLSSGYYLTPYDARPDHPLHPVLRPGGTVGVLLGTTGTALMVAMHTYSLRKLLPSSWSSIGSPAWWLRFHILCGLAGPALIVLHGGLYLPSGLIAVAFWCMLLVSASGVFGRYVYGYFPRTAAGTEMSRRAVAARISDLREALVAQTGTAEADRIGAAVTLARGLHTDVRGLGGLVALDLEVRRRARRIRRLLAGAGLPRDAERGAAATLVAQLHLARSAQAWQATQRLFKYWHLLHEPLAQAMYLIVAWHVFTAFFFGGALETLLQWIP